MTEVLILTIIQKPRIVNLGNGCRKPKIALHEIMHALGKEVMLCYQGTSNVHLF